IRAIVFDPPPPTPTILMLVRSFDSMSSSSASTRVSSNIGPFGCRLFLGIIDSPQGSRVIPSRGGAHGRSAYKKGTERRVGRSPEQDAVRGLRNFPAMFGG